MSEFPQRLRTLRELSQAQLAARSGLHNSAVSHFEIGTRLPSFDNLRRLADAPRVTTDHLVGRSESLTGAVDADPLSRDIERLSVTDRGFVATLVKQLIAARDAVEEKAGQ